MCILLSGMACLSKESSSQTEATDQNVQVALITSSGGLGDRSFNDAGYAGFKRAEQELGVTIKVIEPQSSADYLQSVKLVAQAGTYNLIMVLGNDWGDAIDTVAPNYPDTHFASVNLNTSHDNLAVARFADHEGSFLAGALAALESQTGKVGFIGGMDIPAIQRFFVGYKEGAKYINPNIEVYSTYVGSFADPFKGKEFALQLIGQGCDIIFHAAGKTGEGLFEAVKEQDGVFAIGVDQDQDSIVPGKVLTSMLKKVDVAAYDYIQQVIQDNFVSGITMYGVEEHAVGLSEMTYTKEIIHPKSLAEIDDISEKISSGEIQVTDIFIQ